MSATDEQFAAAYDAFYAQAVATDSFPLAVDMGRAMFAALEAHGCIPKPQGLTARQELVARIVCASLQGGWSPEETPDELADKILALEERNEC